MNQIAAEVVDGGSDAARAHNFVNSLNERADCTTGDENARRGEPENENNEVLLVKETDCVVKPRALLWRTSREMS